MSLRYRKRASLGPLRLNIGRKSASLAVKLGPFTWNLNRRRLTTNLPSGFYHQTDLDDRKTP